jgi:O-methyltransferase
VPGGFLIIHDYMSLYWDGVEKAINEFFADKPERFIPIPDKSGTIVIRKH